MSQGRMAPLGTRCSRDTEGAQDETAKECTPTAYAAIHNDILEELQLRFVKLVVLRPIPNIGLHRLDITPASIRSGDVVGSIVPEHLAPPDQGLVRLFPVYDKAEVPGRQPLERRIQFKLLMLTYKCLHGQAPLYLRELVSPYNPARPLRSADRLLLCQPRARTKIGERTFSYAAPFLWNRLPLGVRQCTSVQQFKVTLKLIYSRNTTRFNRAS